jgi:TPP-dependent pyruvate/acetoin dehydrogenase alpha subunit
MVQRLTQVNPSKESTDHRSSGSAPLDRPAWVTLGLYRKMLTVALVEERLQVFSRQGKCTFQASTRGHEKLQIGMTMLLRPGHDFFPYYLSKAIAIGLGMPLKDVFLGMLSRAGDPSSNGRNMPEQSVPANSISCRKQPSPEASICRPSAWPAR